MRANRPSRAAKAALLSFILLPCAGGFPAYAPLAGNGIPAAIPTSAQAFAATIDHHYNQMHALSVHFTQKYTGMGMHRQESGVLLLKRPGRLAGAVGKMRWSYSDPAGKLFILDGRDAYFYTPGQSEIPRVPAKKLDDLRSPLAFLLGHAELASELDGLSFERSGMATWTLRGVPHGMQKRIASFAIVAQVDGTIDVMRIEETDGAINIFQMTDELANPPIPQDAFTFIPPPGTHVIEGMPPI